MLHSFWYEKASETFAAVAEKDPTCGMAYWGIAMTYYHQIWQPPGPADLKAGSTYVKEAKLVGAKTQRERDYIAAIETFYRDSDKLDHAGCHHPSKLRSNQKRLPLAEVAGWAERS